MFSRPLDACIEAGGEDTCLREFPGARKKVCEHLFVVFGTQPPHPPLNYHHLLFPFLFLQFCLFSFILSSQLGFLFLWLFPIQSPTPTLITVSFVNQHLSYNFLLGFIIHLVPDAWLPDPQTVQTHDSTLLNLLRSCSLRSHSLLHTVWSLAFP